MEISVNGQNRQVAAPLTMVGLLTELGIKPKSVVVERNLKIVAPSEMETESIKDGDAIEIIRLVGGG